MKNLIASTDKIITCLGSLYPAWLLEKTFAFIGQDINSLVRYHLEGSEILNGLIMKIGFFSKVAEFQWKVKNARRRLFLIHTIMMTITMMGISMMTIITTMMTITMIIHTRMMQLCNTSVVSTIIILLCSTIKYTSILIIMFKSTEQNMYMMQVFMRMQTISNSMKMARPFCI